MLYAVLSQKFKTHKTQGNLNNELGVPLTLLSMPEDTEAAVIEMGISDFGEMTRLSEMVQPTICVLTIIGECHLENLGDRDGVLKAKTEMFKNARENADFILNGDDDKLSTVKTVNGKKPVFFGLDAKNDFYAKNIKNSGDGKVLATLCFDNNNIDVEIPAIGTYMVTNALAAAAAGKLLGLTDEEIANGVASYKTVGSRANVINTGKIKIIDDCYNANPTSVRASLDTLSNLDGRKVAILGDMKELGSEELKLHFDTGVYAKSKDIGTVITVGELAKELAKGADGKAFDTIEDAPQRFVGGFGIDFEYLQRGFSFLQNPTEEDPAKYQWYTRRVKSLMLPIVWQPHIYLFKNRMRVYLDAAVFFSYNISSTFINEQGSTVSPEQSKGPWRGEYDFKVVRDNRWGYGLAGGGGVAVLVKQLEFSVRVRYYFGYSDLLRNHNKYAGNTTDGYENPFYTTPQRSPL
ncbi:UDP-N-acetylmuramoylalanyl-D-glutamyl-2, 6-diaminopimelate--D-alanyl- D-alanine ligase, partial [human gut metagenome]